MSFQEFIMGSLSEENSLEVQCMKERSFTSRLTVQNRTDYTIEGLLIEHKSYLDEGNPNMAIVSNLKPGRSVGCNWTFQQAAPSMTGNIIASIFSLGLSNLGAKWGKDYWQLTLKTSKSNSLLTTNNNLLKLSLSYQGDSWFADIAPTDKHISLIIRYHPEAEMFQVALNRNNTNGQSTRYFRS